MNSARFGLCVLLCLAVVLCGSTGAHAQVDPDRPAVQNDPLVRMPGTQPGQASLEAPGRCLNCHAGYNPSVEPGYNWKGSMMAQSARDFLYFACITVAAQDSAWATGGNPNAVDICERCHFPKGWLEGRSDPPNASAMTGADYDGVQCDFCHTGWDPFFETTADGSREGGDWLGYWDETDASDTPSGPAAAATWDADLAEAQVIGLFNGQAFFLGSIPFSAAYTENGSGQYFISSAGEKRASFSDAAARHQMLYSRYHKSRYFCATCHDVSNPVLANLGADPAQPLPTEVDPAYSYYHVERTFSEFALSAYGQQGGAAGLGPFAPEVYETSLQSDHIARCQDCHMRDVSGVACNKNGVPVRPTESVEHPQSGQPLHDLTGGNAWVSWVLASATPGSPNYDAINDSLLNQGPGTLTLDLTQGEGIDPAALLAGVDRAKQQLGLAASIENVAYDSATGTLTFRIQNQTGHKLISGFPEGRRMFVNIKAQYADGSTYEVNPYDEAAGTLKGLQHTYSDPTGTLPTPGGIGPGEVYMDRLVYEMHPESTLTGEKESFHFALATGRHKDNRIPPRGFALDGGAPSWTKMEERLVQPVYYVHDPATGGEIDVGRDYFTGAEIAGGYDDVTVTLPAGAASVELNLCYQTTSREYVEFLRDEIRGTADTLPDPDPSTPANEAYIIQSDAFFSQLAAWGDTIWDLWLHNRNVPGAAPFVMAQATVGAASPCDLAAPTLLEAAPGNGEVALTWSSVPDASGYRVYYDQSDKAQLVAELGITTSFTDTSVTNGVEYCYKVTATDASCESAFSNVLCATPNNQGQADPEAGVTAMETGLYVTAGHGKDKTTVFQSQGAFNQGDEVVIRVTVFDTVSGVPLANATVDLLVSGHESLTLTTGGSNADGVAEAVWKTDVPRKNQPGTAPGSYTVTTKGVTASGYVWDGVTTQTDFTVQ